MTWPNGEPPVGGSKMPFTANVGCSPFGNVTVIGEPIAQVVVVRVAVVDERAVAPSVARTSCEPSIQSTS